MCGRYASTTGVDDLARAFSVDEVRVEPVAPRYNVAPTDAVLAVAARRRRPGGGAPPVSADIASAEGWIRALGTLRWGLVPSWSKDASSGSRMINARAEGIARRPAYRRALVRRRCLIPADAFYEWQVRPDRKARLPWAVRRRDGAPMALAGLWEVWRDPQAGSGAEQLRTCAIVTTAANGALSPIHDRMPLVLDGDDVDRWLDPEIDDPDQIEALLVPAPSDWFAAHPVSTLVNKVGTEGPELLAPLPDCPG